MYKYIVCFMLLIVGCSESASNKQYPDNNFKSVIANVIVKYSIENPSDGVVDTKYKRSECPECKGTGKLGTGDGLGGKECGYCEPDKGSISPFKAVDDYVELFVIAPQTCCQDCICGDNCQCTYPGECLVKKNKGWTVSRCDENGCRVYYPHGPNGQYNPYEQAWAIGQINKRNSAQYQKYSKPIPVDANGNPLLQSNNSKACSTCR